MSNTDLAATLPRLHDVLPDNAGLTLADKRTLVEQAKVLIGQIYAHLHLKKALYGIDPVQRLTLLQYRLENASDEVVQSELEFHRELLDIFTSLHDLHTNYILPIPYRSLTAVLPFLVEEYFDDKQQAHYIVTKLTTGFSNPDFKPGVELLLWNGLPILEAIRQRGEHESGSNAAARFAVGLRSLTIRPLAVSLPPPERQINLQYRSEDGKTHDIQFEWLVLSQGATATSESGTASARAADTLLDIQPDPANLYRDFLLGNQLAAEHINQCRKQLFASASPDTDAADMSERAAPDTTSTPVATRLPSLLKAMAVDTPSGKFGYLRLFSFMVEEEESFLREFTRLLITLPQQGLIFDVRGNAGGLITAAERLLQLLTPHRIEPEKAQFKSDPLVRELCRRNSPSPIVPQIDLKAWLPSLIRAPVSGAIYSTGHPITTESEANNLGQVYTGPVVLITDAYCYSATDMFAAGFRDHQVGKILGANNNTGAGGANVWQHLLLRVLAQAPGLDESGNLGTVFSELPRFADFRVSSRRMLRTGEQAGMPLEDFGVEPDERHFMTQTDILASNTDLIAHAAKLLAAQARYPLDVTVDHSRCELTVKTEGIDRIDWYIDERAGGSIDVKNDKAVIKLAKASGQRTVRLEAYAKDGRNVAAKQVGVECGG